MSFCSRHIIVYMCVHASMCGVCVLACRPQASLKCHSSGQYPPCFLKQDTSLARDSLIQLGCLASKLQGPAYLCFLQLWDCKCRPPCLPFHGFWGSNGPHACVSNPLPSELPLLPWYCQTLMVVLSWLFTFNFFFFLLLEWPEAEKQGRWFIRLNLSSFGDSS